MINPGIRRHRRFEAFTTDAKIVRLICRLVALFSTTDAMRDSFWTAIVMRLITA